MTRQRTQDVVLPATGMVEEATILAWHKAIGEHVEVDEPLCEIETDKAVADVPAPAAGTLAEVLAQPGETVAIETTIAVIAVDDDAEAPDGVSADGGAGDAHASGAAAASSERPGEAAAVGASRDQDSAAVGQAQRPAGATGDASGADAAAVPPGYDDVPYEPRANSRMRRATAEHMTRSLQTAAHVFTEVYVDMTAVAAARDALNDRRAADGASRLSPLPFIVRAACLALRAHPVFNATFTPDQTLLWQERNAGIAVDTPDGLLVPVVRRADELELEDLAERIDELATRARAGRLRQEDLSGATFTISNPGSIGAASAPAIISQPQTAILGVPAIVRRPWVVGSGSDERIAVRPILKLGLSYDHRAADGADAARFMARVRAELEGWPAPAAAA